MKNSARLNTLIGTLFLSLLGALPLWSQAAAQDAATLVNARGPNQDLEAANKLLDKLSPGSDRFDVVLITVEGLNASSLGCYGSNRNLSPRIDALAKRSVVFKRAFSASPHRATALASLIYSQYPRTLFAMKASPPADVIAQFTNRGYLSYGFARQDIRLDRSEGQGKILSELPIERNRMRGDRGTDLLKKLVARLNSMRRTGERLFGWLNLDYTQGPRFYTGKMPQRGSGLQGRYDTAVTNVDQTIGDFIDLLAELELTKKTILVICGTAATGDNLKGKVEHEDLMDDAYLHVPMIFCVPGLVSRRVENIVETIDLAPTLISLARFKPENTVQGESLLPLMVMREPVASKNTAWSERMPFPGESSNSARSSLRTAKGRRVLRDREVMADLAPNLNNPEPTSQSVTLSAAEQEELKGLTETMLIYSDLCARSWQNNLNPVAHKLEDLEGLRARARWLFEKKDRRALKFALKLLESSPNPEVMAAAILLEFGSKTNGALAAQLTKSPDARMRAFGGACLCRYGRMTEGLDHAIAGMELDLSESAMTTLIAALAATKNERAIAAIRNFEPKEGMIRLEAARCLALASLGDLDAQDQLGRFLLAPTGDYDKQPFITAILKHSPKRASALFQLCLSDGDDRHTTVGAVLKALEELDDPLADRAVATALGNSDTAIREQAAALLDKWQSTAGYLPLVKLANAEEDAFVTAASSLVDYPGYLASPILAGQDYRSAKRKPDLGPRSQTLTFPMFEAEGTRFVLMVESDDPNQAPDLYIRMNDRGNLKIFTSIYRSGVWVIGADIPTGALEKGTNKLQFANRGDRSRKLLVQAFAVIPPSETRLVPILALKYHEPKDQNLATGHFYGDQKSYKLWYSVRGFSDIKDHCELRVEIGDRFNQNKIINLAHPLDMIDLGLTRAPHRGATINLSIRKLEDGVPFKIRAMILAH